MKSRRLTPEEHRSRLSSGVCPRCGDYTLIRVVKVSQEDDVPRFGGAYYACGSEKSHLCYWLSYDTATDLRESTEGTQPVKAAPQVSNRPTVIRRHRTG